MRVEKKKGQLLNGGSVGESKKSAGVGEGVQ